MPILPTIPPKRGITSGNYAGSKNNIFAVSYNRMIE